MPFAQAYGQTSADSELTLSYTTLSLIVLILIVIILIIYPFKSIDKFPEKFQPIAQYSL